MDNEETDIKLSRIHILFNEDQADRYDIQQWSTQEKIDAIALRDTKRLAEVQMLLEENELHAPDDLYYAAMIFQHGSSVEHFKKANRLAEQSMDLGYEPAKWLYAASLDRALLNEGKPQKFGTQYKITTDREKEYFPCDPTTTDEERKKYNVPRLNNIVK
ncbi:MAG: hypothetical protein ABIO02_04700 [Patescibacteria group bacterium]